MQIITDKISLLKLRESAPKMFGNLVKAVVDIEKEIMAIDGELHADEQSLLIENGSEHPNLWGINIYPGKSGDEFVKFDSVINISPVRNNRTRGVENPEIRKKILEVVDKLVEK